MILASQNMNGIFDVQTLNQFSTGVVLASEASVSDMIIGTSAGARLVGKGNAFVNSNKFVRNARQDNLVRIPFIPYTTPGNDVANKDLDYLQTLLNKISNATKNVYYV